MIGALVVSAACAPRVERSREVEPSRASTSQDPLAAPPSSAASPSASSAPTAACKDDAAALARYLGALRREGVGHGEMIRTSPEHFDYRPLPDVKLVEVDAPPTDPPFLALVVLARGKLAFGDTVASSTDARAARAIFERAKESGFSPGFGSGGHDVSRFHMAVSFFVDEGASWREVVTSVTAARAAGFTEVVFALAAKSEVAAPKASPLGARLREIASAPGRAGVGQGAGLDAAFLEATARCPDVGAPFARAANDTSAEIAQRDAFVTGAPAALLACGCAIDRADVEAFAWLKFGRFWGPALTDVTLDIGSTLRGAETKPTLRPFKAKGQATFASVSSELRALPRDEQFQLVAE